jgi:hypothetical protein
MTDITQLSTNKIWSLGIIGALTLVVLISLGSVFETLDSKEVMVIQYPNGTLQTYVEPG